MQKINKFKTIFTTKSYNRFKKSKNFTIIHKEQTLQILISKKLRTLTRGCINGILEWFFKNTFPGCML